MQFFEEASSSFVKDLVDFQNKDDFANYMARLESDYFKNVAKVSKFPYPTPDSVPSYPPKPVRSNRSLSGSPSRNENDMTDNRDGLSHQSFEDFAHTVHTLNSLRSGEPQR